MATKNFLSALPTIKRAGAGRKPLAPVMAEALLAAPGTLVDLGVFKAPTAAARARNLRDHKVEGGTIDAATRTIDGEVHLLAMFTPVAKRVRKTKAVEVAVEA
jgi:hypothetical protein